MVYFDNAATTFPKPPTVVSEVIRCMTSYCGNPGRSGHVLSLKAAEKIYDCREILAKTFGSNFPTNVVFTPNTTYALNIAINSLVKRKCHILISDLEHNSVYRTVNSLTQKGIDYDIFSVDEQSVDNTLRSLKSKIRSNTCLVVCTHASNVCGITLPIYEIGQMCGKMGIRFIVDAAQSAGTHKIDISRYNIDALCCPGHKGLYGPQGSGFIIFADKYADEKQLMLLPPYVYGGNGVNSAEKNMPPILPERYEGGTLNTPCIAGLYEGVKFVRENGEDKIFDHVSLISEKALDILNSIPKVKIYCPNIKKSSCLLFNIDSIPSDTVADILNNDGICTRGGLHCSPLAHKKLKTENGAVRISFSVFNTLSELDVFYKSLKNISKQI